MFLARRVAETYLNQVIDGYRKTRHVASRFGLIWELVNSEEMLEQVALEALLYVMCNLGKDRLFTQLSSSIGKRSEYVLWLNHPKWGQSLHIKALKLASHNDLGMPQLVRAMKNSKNWRHGCDYKPLTVGERLALGGYLVEMMSLHTGMIDVEMEVKNNRRARVVRYSQLYWDFLKRWRDNTLMFRPLYMPMVLPPKPYTTHHDGGYYSIVTSCSTVDWERFDPIIKASQPVVLRALNRLQEEPFQLDQAQLALLQNCWNLGHAIGDLPSSERLEEPTTPSDIARTRDDWSRIWAWKADRAKNAVRSRFIHSLIAADRLKDHKRIWFCWQMDHRGRLYPRGSQINYGSGDPFRSMLRFDRVSPVKGHEQELSWHLGSALGLPPSRLIRWDWLQENSGLVERIGANPIDQLAHWSSAKEPWRFVQICRDWSGYVADPGYQTGTIYRLDQTTSGYGHAACLLRDQRLAEFTNIVGDRAVDLYTGFSRLLKQRMEVGVRSEEDEKRRHCMEWWLAHWPGRGLFKVMVMPIVYGRTYKTLQDTISEYLRDELKNYLTEDGTAVFHLATVLAGSVHSFAKELLPGLLNMVKWLGDLAAVQMHNGKRPAWLTPNGMLVESYRTEAKEEWVELRLSGKRMRFSAQDHEGGALKVSASKRQIGADFVHSMDAAFLQTFVAHWGDGLRKPIVTVHDCFGTTLENAATMRAELNDQWHRFYQRDYLEEHWRWVEQCTGSMCKPPPWVGTLDTKRIGENPFLFS